MIRHLTQVVIYTLLTSCSNKQHFRCKKSLNCIKTVKFESTSRSSRWTAGIYPHTASAAELVHYINLVAHIHEDSLRMATPGFKIVSLQTIKTNIAASRSYQAGTSLTLWGLKLYVRQRKCKPYNSYQSSFRNRKVSNMATTRNTCVITITDD
jgi:hypothetical protein